MCGIRINLGLTINAGALLTLSRRVIFGGPAIAFGVIGKSLSAVKLELMKITRKAKHLFSVRNRDVLLNAQSRHKWWSSLKSAGFGVSSSLPLLVGGGTRLACGSVGKADLLSDHFDSKQSRDSVDLPLTCHLSPNLVTFAFRSSEVRRLLLDLDPCGGTDPLGMFPIFLKRTADVLAPRLSVPFRRLLHLGNFRACWR